MIRVTVDLVPFGDETQKRTLTFFEIANDGTGTVAQGNYMVRFQGDPAWFPTVSHWDRKRDVLELVGAVLSEELS